LSLGQELGVRIVAEGVETENHHSKLKEMGCLIGQGYLFSHPLPVEQLTALLSTETLQPLVT
jgi:EAL domain-containing protein (putative c-di-GMP-specific phosphodiesterase class I)